MIKKGAEKVTHMVDSSKSKVKPRDTSARRKKSVIEHEVMSHDTEQKTQNFVEPVAIEKQSKQSTQNKRTSHRSWIFLLVSGILGGLIALGLWVGGQWAGVLPSSLVSSHAGGEKALQIAEDAKSQAEETMGQLGRVLQAIDTLKAEFASFSLQHVEGAQGDEVWQEESRKAFAALEKKVNDLEEYVQALVGVSEDIKTVLFVGQNNANDLAALKQQFETVKEKIVVKNDEKESINTALFIAVNSLKNAIERGGSYVGELKLLQQLSPSIDGLDLLQQTATTGLPNSVQLSADFAHVADAIVGTQNIAASDAHFFEQIWAWIKGLVVLRPVGDVEGMTLGAIAARMEVAVQMGDYEKALSEWKTLPQSAKDVSIDFVQKLERHIAVCHLLQQLLMLAQQESFKATKM